MLDHAQLPTGPIRPLRRHEYEQLAELGAFDPAERIELLEGVIYQMSPIGRRHGLAVGRLARRLGAAIDATWDIIPQSSFEATAWSMPEPDIAVFARANKRSKDARLVIEVADSSLAHDRYKARIYAQARVPEYWIINLQDAVVELHRSPRDGVYTTVGVARAGERLTSSAFPQLTLVLDDDVFPPDDEPAVSRRPPRPRRPRRSPAGRTRSR